VPEITATHIAILVVALIIGTIIGWVGRSNRAISEKSAINDGWQEQLAAQNNEHERLLDQNKSLMEQNSQYQASNKDAKMRASELSDALKEAFERRDELQRQLKDIRSNLESSVAARDQLQNDMQSRDSENDDVSVALQEKDERIEKLGRELENWQDRLPPLIEKFRQRNAEAEELEKELAAARERIAALDAMVGSDQTRVEPVDPDAMTDGMDASNEPIEEEPLESPAGNDDARDDLKKIKGVGPAIEKTLNEMGICHYNQIAEMSEYEIDRVAHRLRGFRSRIYREDWIGQARDLYDQKVSGQL
jgi:predicted flap endonuclease-1-like 5' DNA nuclease